MHITYSWPFDYWPLLVRQMRLTVLFRFLYTPHFLREELHIVCVTFFTFTQRCQLSPHLRHSSIRSNCHARYSQFKSESSYLESLLHQSIVTMAHLYSNIGPIESSYKLKSLSSFNRRPVAALRHIPALAPKEASEETINLIEGDTVEERVHSPKLMSFDDWKVEIASQL